MAHVEKTSRPRRLRRPGGPPLYDPVENPDASAWLPANDATAILVACVGACRDIMRVAAGLKRNRIAEDARGIGLLATPIISLADNARKLKSALDRADRSGWPEEDRENLRAVGKSMNKLMDGPLRAYRNRRSAHVDHTAIYHAAETPTKPTLDLVLPPLRDALFVLVLLTNHRDVFSWTRSPNAAEPAHIELIHDRPVSFTFERGPDGHVKSIVGGTITADPRHRAHETIFATIDTYNRLAGVAGADHPPIELTERE
jgi:hypothetical protein